MTPLITLAALGEKRGIICFVCSDDMLEGAGANLCDASVYLSRLMEEDTSASSFTRFQAVQLQASLAPNTGSCDGQKRTQVKRHGGDTRAHTGGASAVPDNAGAERALSQTTQGRSERYPRQRRGRASAIPASLISLTHTSSKNTAEARCAPRPPSGRRKGSAKRPCARR